MRVYTDCTGALIEDTKLRLVIEQPCHLWGRQWSKWVERTKTMTVTRSTGHRELGREHSEPNKSIQFFAYWYMQSMVELSNTA